MIEDCTFCIRATTEEELLSQAESIYDLVWRFELTAPGFCLIDTGSEMDSHTLRAWMIALKGQLSHIGVARGRQSFAYRSMGRFDQQETTKFHRDGAPAESLLMLGYEPSNVRSRIFLADSTRAAFDLGISHEHFFVDYNPMYRRGEEVLTPYITELPQPHEGHSRILLVNNSSLSFNEDRSNPLGGMHKAVIDSPSDQERRIVNSTMLVLAAEDEIPLEQQQAFVATDQISKKVY